MGEIFLTTKVLYLAGALETEIKVEGKNQKKQNRGQQIFLLSIEVFPLIKKKRFISFNLF